MTIKKEIKEAGIQILTYIYNKNNAKLHPNSIEVYETEDRLRLMAGQLIFYGYDTTTPEKTQRYQGILKKIEALSEQRLKGLERLVLNGAVSKLEKPKDNYISWYITQINLR